MKLDYSLDKQIKNGEGKEDIYKNYYPPNTPNTLNTITLKFRNEYSFNFII